MTRSQLTLSLALLGSLGVNAWQYKQQSSLRANADPAESSRLESGGEDGLLPANRSRPGETAAQAVSAGPSLAHSNLADILAIRDPMDRMQALIAHVKTLRPDEIGDMLKTLRGGKQKLDPQAQFLSQLLLTRWGQEDPEAAFASLGNVSAKQGGGDANTILAGLASTDPARALAWLSDPDNTLQHQPWMGHMLARTLTTEWSRQDPDAALAWAASLDPGEQRTGAYAGILGNILETDPARAASVAMELDPVDRPRLLGEIAGTWAQTDPREAVDWASSLEGRDRAAALSDALRGWAQTAPGDAAAYLDRLPEGERGDHVGDLARTWAQRAPAEAAHWLSTQPEGGEKRDAMGHVMWNWTNANPEAASTWLAEQPRGEAFDQGVAGLAKAATHAFDDHEAGATWASQIQNPELRESMTRHTVREWMGHDPAAAQAWTTQNGIEVPAARAAGGK